MPCVAAVVDVFVYCSSARRQSPMQGQPHLPGHCGSVCSNGLDPQYPQSCFCKRMCCVIGDQTSWRPPNARSLGRQLPLVFRNRSGQHSDVDVSRLCTPIFEVELA